MTQNMTFYTWPHDFFFALYPQYLKRKQNFAILSPDQLPYNLTWDIRFIKPKLNIFVDDISWYHTSKKGFFVYWDQMNSLCTFQKGHIKFTHISNKTLTSKINSISQINKTSIPNRGGCMEKGMNIWSYFYNQY